jgi:hypothetical protein
LTRAGRGYPNIDSLKEISNYFSVTIDDLLSSEKLLSIAEKENKSNIQNLGELLFGMIDLFSLLLIILPLYPNTVDGYIYSVNLFAYDEITLWKRFIYWGMFLALMLIGVIKILLMKFQIKNSYKYLTDSSMVLHILLVLFLAMARETYAIAMAFILLVIKGILLLKYITNV